MAGSEKRGPRRGRGRSKRPREPEPEDDRRSSGPRDPPATHSFAAINNASSASSTVNAAPQASASVSASASASAYSMSQPPAPSGSELGSRERTQLPATDTKAPPGKVAIPSLRPSSAANPSSKASKKGRTSHACDLCRKAKAGCTGEQPCVRCRTAQVACVYGDGKRDKERKRMSKLDRKSSALTQHQADVTEALRRIRLDANISSVDEIRSAIDHVLAMTPAPVSSDEGAGSAPPSRRMSSAQTERERQQDSDEDDAADVGSTGSIDLVNVDTDRVDVRPTGHMGKSSAVAWAKRTAQECDDGNGSATAAFGDPGTGFAAASYHAEDADFNFVNTEQANPFEWPDPKEADHLVQVYFDCCHLTLPIVDKNDFMTSYSNFMRGIENIPDDDERIFLGTLNVIFAISSVHIQLNKTASPINYHQHLWYISRAKKLGMDQGYLYSDARVSTTRFLGLMCLYYMTMGRINRAWTFCGLAIRQALTLGMHVRSEARGLSDLHKEQRVRTWWSLYTLECSLNELTGRPTCISDRDISTPLPVNIDVDKLGSEQTLYKYDSPAAGEGSSGATSRHSSKGQGGRQAATYQMPIGTLQPASMTFPVVELPLTPSTFFIYRSQLVIISHEIVTELYCASAIKEKWFEVQSTIERIDKRLLAWRDSLPKEFDINIDPWVEPDWQDHYTYARLSLAMHFNSSRMILYRPCLCRFEGRPGLGAQSENSKDFNQEAVETCIHSARQTISHLEGAARNAQRLYSLSPWWNVLHYLCEALSVLMLEMAYRSQHLPREAAYILGDTKKGINWLSMMAERSVSARKAWEIFDSLMRQVAPKIRWSVFDMPTEAPIPPGYNASLLHPNMFSEQPNTSNTQQWHRYQEATQATHTALSESNLNYATTQAIPVSNQTSTNAWAFMSADTPVYTGVYPRTEQLMANPLDNTTAVQHFSNIWGVHGGFDDPAWNMFDYNETGMDDSGLGSGMSAMGTATAGPAVSMFAPSQFVATNNMAPTGMGYPEPYQGGQQQGDEEPPPRRFF